MERIALTLGLSICITVFTGFGLNYTSWGIRLPSILGTLSLFTLLMLMAVLFIRMYVPMVERFTWL